MSEGCGFNSRHHILDGHFFTFICFKNCNVCFNRPKINENRGRGWPIDWIRVSRERRGAKTIFYFQLTFRIDVFSIYFRAFLLRTLLLGKENECAIKVTHDWTRTWVLWCRKFCGTGQSQSP